MPRPGIAESLLACQTGSQKMHDFDAQVSNVRVSPLFAQADDRTRSADGK